MPQPRSRKVRPAHEALRASRPRRRRRGRRRGSRARTSPGGRQMFGLAAGRPGATRRPPRTQTRTRPFGVWNFAAMMPGMPCGATQSTLTSSSGASTVWPSHSLTRCGSPAISRQASEKSPSAPAEGCSASGLLPLDEERQLRVGDQAVDADLLPLQLGAVGPVPVAGRRLAAEARSTSVMSSTETTQPSQPPPSAVRRARPGRTAPCRRPDGRAPRRFRGRCRSASGRIMLRVPKRGWMPPSVNVLPQQATDPPRRGREAIGCGGVREMVQTHVKHSGLRRLETTHWGTGFLTSRFLTRPVASEGSAGCRPSGDRDRTWASACSTSAAYPAVPISSVSSAALVT